MQRGAARSSSQQRLPASLVQEYHSVVNNEGQLSIAPQNPAWRNRLAPHPESQLATGEPSTQSRGLRAQCASGPTGPARQQLAPQLAGSAELSAHSLHSIVQVQRPRALERTRDGNFKPYSVRR